MHFSSLACELQNFCRSCFSEIKLWPWQCGPRQSLQITPVDPVKNVSPFPRTAICQVLITSLECSLWTTQCRQNVSESSVLLSTVSSPSQDMTVLQSNIILKGNDSAIGLEHVMVSLCCETPTTLKVILLNSQHHLVYCCPGFVSD